MELLLFITLICLTNIIIFTMYKIFKKRGLYFSLVLLNIISFVMSFKIANIFQININLGIIGIISSMSIIFIFLEKYKSKGLKELITINFYSGIIVSLLLTIMNFYVPIVTETISINMVGTFQSNYKILILYPLIILLSQYLSIKLYKLLSTLQKNTNLNIMITYIIVGILYTVIMSILSYIKILDFSSSIFIGVSTYMIGLLIMSINLIIIKYIANKKEEI